MAELTKEQIEDIKKKRATAKRMMQDRLRYVVGMQAVPAIIVMVGTMVASAYYLKSESVAVISAMISSVVMGLINVLQQMTAPPTPPSAIEQAHKDTSHSLDKLIDHSIQTKNMRMKMDRNTLEINGDGVEMESHIPEHPVYGDDKPLTKGKK